jgi:hypothetical protein
MNFEQDQRSEQVYKSKLKGKERKMKSIAKEEICGCSEKKMKGIKQ